MPDTMLDILYLLYPHNQTARLNNLFNIMCTENGKARI